MDRALGVCPHREKVNGMNIAMVGRLHQVGLRAGWTQSPMLPRVKLGNVVRFERSDVAEVIRQCARSGFDMPSMTARRSRSIIGSANLLGCGALGETVRQLIKDDPGVVKIRMGRRNDFAHSVPESAPYSYTLLNAG